MSGNDITDFLLAEYKNIAEAYFNAHEITAKWFKFYLLIIASPFSIIVFLYHNVKSEFNVFNLSSTVSLLLIVIGIISMLISFIIINSRLDASLYARTVNGIRKYFVNQSKVNKGKIKQTLLVDDYLVLPTDMNHPRFIKYGGDLFILVICMTSINATYISHGYIQYVNPSTFIKPMLGPILFLIIVSIHLVYYYKFAKKKEKTYSKKVS